MTTTYWVRDGERQIEMSSTLAEAKREYKDRLSQGYDNLMLIETVDGIETVLKSEQRAMAQRPKSHTYRGHEICPVEYADKRAQGYRWYIAATHQATGISWDSQHCTHVRTLAAARKEIDYQLSMQDA